MKDNEKNNEVAEKKTFKEKAKETLAKAKKPAIFVAKALCCTALAVGGLFIGMALANAHGSNEEDSSDDSVEVPFEVVNDDPVEE